MAIRFKQILANLFRPQVTGFTWLGREGQAPKFSKSKLVEVNTSWAYTCASRNAESCAAIPLRLYVEGGTSRYPTKALSPDRRKHLGAIRRKAAEDVIEIPAGHPLLELLDHVNPWQTGFEFRALLTLWQELTGDAYIYVEPGPLGVPVNLWVLDSRYMRVVPDKTNYLTGYLYGKTAQESIAFEPSEVIHLKYENPADAYYGLSPAEAAFGSISLLRSEQEFEQSLYDNGGMPEVAVVTKTALTEDQQKQLQAAWRDKWGSGRRNTGVPAFLSGELDIKTLSHPPRDTGIELSKRYSREDILAAFGVPTTMVQLSEASKAGAVAGNYSYAKYTIEPKLRRLGEQLTEQLAARYDPRLILAFDSCVPADEQSRRQDIQVFSSTGYMTINELRAQDGLDPVPWGDEPKQSTSPFPAVPESDDSESEETPPETPEKRVKAAGKRKTFEQSVRGYMMSYAADVVKRMEETRL